MLPMYVQKHQLCLSEQYRESLNMWSATIRINIEENSLIMKLGPVLPNYEYHL